jgi:hypothetical protein
MFQKLASCLAVAAVVAAAATVSAQSKKSGGAATGKGQAYDLEVVFDSTAYTGTMTLVIAKKGGAVTGSMMIDQPTRVTGEVAGTLDGDLLALDYAYTMQEDNCTGRVTVSAKMAPTRDAASGTATASGCSDTPIEGTFALKKTAPKPKS